MFSNVHKANVDISLNNRLLSIFFKRNVVNLRFSHNSHSLFTFLAVHALAFLTSSEEQNVSGQLPLQTQHQSVSWAFLSVGGDLEEIGRRCDGPQRRK